MRELFLHYKGGLYEKLGHGIHTETNEKLVMYKSCQDGKLYARPFDMFHGLVTVDGEEVRRFKFLGKF